MILKPLSRNLHHVRMAVIITIAVAFFSLVPTILVWGASSTAFKDPLNTPARTVGQLKKRPLLDVTRAGKRLVAVGMRGLIIFSDDNGKSWHQASVPVQSDLLAVQFPTAKDGWAVGHGGVILHTSDGGASWHKQLDGLMAGKQFESYYKMQSRGNNPSMKQALNSVQLDFKNGSTQPFLDVWFKNAENGYVIGSFGLIASTRNGGGLWIPWLQRIEDPNAYNLNSIGEFGGNLYIAGERGMVYKLSQSEMTFKKIVTGAQGSFFGIAGNTNVLLAFGLQGIIYRSRDAGAKWQKIHSPTHSTITAGAYDKQSGQFFLVTVAGQILVGNKNGGQFHIESVHDSMLYTSILPLGKKHLCLTAIQGLQILAINSKIH